MVFNLLNRHSPLRNINFRFAVSGKGNFPYIIIGSVYWKDAQLIIPAHIYPAMTFIKQGISPLVKHLVDQCILGNCTAVVGTDYVLLLITFNASTASVK